MGWDICLVEDALRSLAERMGCAVEFTPRTALIAGPPEKLNLLLDSLRGVADKSECPSVRFDDVVTVALRRTVAPTP